MNVERQLKEKLADLAPKLCGDCQRRAVTNPLRVLAPAICAHVRPGGRLALSGILREQAEEIIAIFNCAAWLIERMPPRMPASSSPTVFFRWPASWKRNRHCPPSRSFFGRPPCLRRSCR